jgi:hypothetical protein
MPESYEVLNGKKAITASNWLLALNVVRNNGTITGIYADGTRQYIGIKINGRFEVHSNIAR